MSGGVMMAATIIIIRNACLRYRESISADTISILAAIRAIMGSWNTMPISKDKVVKVDI